MFIDAKLVGQGELPVTIPLLLGLAAGVSWARTPVPSGRSLGRRFGEPNMF